MKRILAGLLTAIIMGVIVWTGLGPSASKSHRTTNSEVDSRFQEQVRLQGATDHIEGLLASARAGDAASYLSSFGGPLRARLERDADERGRAAFALSLRRAGLARKSHALFDPEPEGERQGAARITVESTYADRLERQTFHLERAAGGWVVTEVETAREHVPKNPLGSLATYEAPEGIPVGKESRRSAGDVNQK
jgi:hypothetical protein